MISFLVDAFGFCSSSAAVSFSDIPLVEERTANLQATNDELDDFAHIVSHDLKAPLRGITQLAGWITDDFADVLDQAGKDKLALLIVCSQRMNIMIDSILQYYRIGRFGERENRVDLSQLVQETIELLVPPKHIHISIEDELPTVVGERTRLTQVFQNLLSNTIKFMDKPEGLISVSCVKKKSHWQFSVADNGTGIKKKHHEKFFGIFQTLATSDQSESTGIGLALVKKIVKGWDGQIWLESTVGEGSVFYFTLPKKDV